MADDFTCCANIEGTVTFTFGETVTSCHTSERQMWERGVAKLWLPASKLRRQNRLIPGAPGRRPRRGAVDERQVELPMSFQAADLADPARLVHEAADAFWDAIGGSVTSGDGTVTCTVLSFDETRSRSGPVTLDGFEPDGDPQAGPGWVLQDYTLTLTIPGGELPLVP